jgi:hypothetical protein
MMDKAARFRFISVLGAGIVQLHSAELTKTVGAGPETVGTGRTGLDRFQSGRFGTVGFKNLNLNSKNEKFSRKSKKYFKLQRI